MTTTREQVGAIIWSMLMIASVSGVGTVGSVAAANQPHGSVQAGAAPDNLIGSETTQSPDQTGSISESHQSTGPVKITDWHDLNDVRNDTEAGRFKPVINKSYVLTNDLDKNTPGYESVAGPNANEGQGFNPIGAKTIPTNTVVFTGTFDGNGHTIADYVINRTNSDGRSGLFAHSDGTIKNLHIGNATVRGDTNADSRRPNIEVTGILVGAHGGLIENVTTSGTVDGGNYVGGVVGSHNNDGDGPHKLNNITTSAQVAGNTRVGGIAGGVTSAAIANSTATGSVNGENSVGGIAGEVTFSGSVVHSQSSGNATGASSVGGLIGEIDRRGRLKNSESSATVSGPKEVGGAVGYLRDGGDVVSSSATGQVVGESGGSSENADIGGLVGRVGEGGSISKSAATGTVRTDAAPVGGLVGRTGERTEVRASYASADVLNRDFGKAGGLAGKNPFGLIKNSYATGNVTAKRGGLTGGLLGNNGGTVEASYAAGNVTGSNSGGLYGFSFGQANNTYWDINTTGQSIGHNAIEDLEGGTGLPTSAMTGEEAPTNLSGFDFSTNGAWRAQTGDYPVLAWQDSRPNQSRNASVRLTNRTVKNGTETVTVDSASLTKDGGIADYVVVVYVVNDGGSISDPVGYSANQSGRTEDILVNLNADGTAAPNSLTQKTTLRAMLHETSGDSGFGPSLNLATDDADVTVSETVGAQVQIAEVNLAPSSVSANTTNDHDLTFDAVNVSDDGNTDSFTVTIPSAATLESANSVSVVAANETDVSLSGGPDVSGNEITFDVAPDSSADTRTLSVTANVTVAAPAVENETTADITVDVADSNNGQASANVTLTVQPAAQQPTDPAERALQAAGVNNASAIEQSDITTLITLRDRGQPANGVNVSQRDITTLITLRERARESQPSRRGY